MATTAEILGQIPFFALLDEGERAALAERVDHTSAAKGKDLFKANEPGGSLYVVVKGAVELWFKKDSGEKVVVETAKSGDFFGEISLLDGGPRTANATCVEDAEMIVVTREPWAIENGFLTPTMKVRRSRIEAAVQAQVERWYAGGQKVQWA